MERFHLVEFLGNEYQTEAKEIAAIPSAWMVGETKCYWPPHESRPDAHGINSGNTPDPAHRSLWTGHSIPSSNTEVVHSEAAVSSDGGLPRLRRNRILRRTRSSGSDGDAGVEKAKKKRQCTYTPATSYSSDDEDGCTNLQETPPPPAFNPSPHQPLSTQTTSTHLPLHPSLSPRASTSRENLTTPPIPSSAVPAQSPVPAVQTLQLTNFESYFKMVFEELADHWELLKNVQQSCQNLHSLIPRSPAAEVERPALPEGFTFPLSHPQQLHMLDSRLQQEDIRKSMAEYLGNLGGRNARDCLNRVAGQVISTSLARLYNLRGMRKKRSMACHQAVLSTLYEAVRKSYPSTTMREMEDALAKWLANSRDRDGGKRERTFREAQ